MALGGRPGPAATPLSRRPDLPAPADDCWADEYRRASESFDAQSLRGHVRRSTLSPPRRSRHHRRYCPRWLCRSGPPACEATAFLRRSLPTWRIASRGHRRRRIGRPNETYKICWRPYRSKGHCVGQQSVPRCPVRMFSSDHQWGWTDAPPGPRSSPGHPETRRATAQVLGRPHLALSCERPGARRATAASGDRAVGPHGHAGGRACTLEVDAMVLIGRIHWLRSRSAKLHNDRLHPAAPANWSTAVGSGQRSRRRCRWAVVTNDGDPSADHAVARMLNRITKAAGIRPRPSPFSCATLCHPVPSTGA